MPTRYDVCGFHGDCSLLPTPGDWRGSSTSYESGTSVWPTQHSLSSSFPARKKDKLWIISWRKDPISSHFPFCGQVKKSSLAFGESFKLDNQPARLPYPFIKQSVKFIAHPPQLTAVLLGRPQGRGGWLRPSPKRSPVSGSTSFLFAPSLELLVPGDGGCVGLRVDPDSTSSCKERKVRWEKRKG